jgi:hypothetical protein
MMTNNRLRQLEKILDRFRQQLNSKEECLTSIAPEEKMRIKQQISDLKDDIKPFEKEYWELLSEHLDEANIPEAEVEAIIVEIVDQSDKLQRSQDFSEEVLVWLHEIHQKVSQPGPTAAAKLKGVLSSIPPFVGISYEAELDTENFLRTYFPTFLKWARALAKK